MAHPVWWQRVEVRVVHSLGLQEHGALVPRVNMVHQTQDDTGDARCAATVAQLPAAAGEPQHRIDHSGPRQAYLHAHARLLSALRYRCQDSAAVIHPAVRVPPPLTGSGWWVRSAPVQDQATAVLLVKKMGQQPLSTPVAPKCASTKHRACYPRTPRQADAQHACQSCWRWTYLRFEVRDRAELRYKQLQVCNAVCSMRKPHSDRCKLSLHPSTDIQARQLKAMSKGCAPATTLALVPSQSSTSSKKHGAPCSPVKMWLAILQYCSIAILPISWSDW
jgi:hypothetical protein